ncbi:hypothetical protein ACWGH5_18060 [Streptomyces sp. NPDC054864]
MTSHGLQPDRGTTPVGNDLEHALLRMRVLVEEAVSKARRTNSLAEDGLALLPDPSDERIRMSAERLISTARRSVSLALPYRTATTGPTAAQSLTSLLDRLRQISAAGVTVRILGGPGILEDPHVQRHLDESGPDTGLHVRISGQRHQGVVIVDESIALLNAEFGRARRQSLTVRVPAVLRSLDALYACAWSKATPASYYRRVFVRSRNDMTRRVLEFLVSGSTDEAAAQALGLSVRTYRRHVAGLMQELGAGSRFQAGARAVELGLLEPQLAG